MPKNMLDGGQVSNANISADKNPGGAGVWELPGLGQSQPAFGGRHQA
jgi:acetolactate synthase I/II/III large subunit